MTTPLRASMCVVLGIAAMLFAASRPPVAGFLEQKLGPKCKRACSYPRTDPLKWELACQDCCDELKRGSRCYADCARGKLPYVCKRQTDPDTGCEGQQSR